MEIRKLIDGFGDDIFALALIVTKDFDSAKQVFIKTALSYKEFSDTDGLYPFAVKAYSECREADSNDHAVTFTQIEFPQKSERLLEQVLQRPQIARAVIHMFYENDLSPEQIAKITGESARYVSSVLAELPAELEQALEEGYKDICAKIRAEDSLKAYAVRATEDSSKREFEVKDEPVPVHKWNRKQKIIVIVVAAIAAFAVSFAIPIIDRYYHMREEEGFSHFENLSPDEIFTRTDEAAVF